MIQSRSGKLFAPCTTKVEMVFPTKHAIGLKLKDGTEMLIHFGLETVNLNGNGFEIFIEHGDEILCFD